MIQNEKKELFQVAICLCTYQGQEFLIEQLDSLLRQSYSNFCIWVSDDGSSDETLSILEKYQTLMGKDRFVICRGPGKGFVANFFSLLCHEDLHADFFTFCDQDDIWKEDKLERAVRYLSDTSSDVPALYGTRTQLINRNGEEIGLSPLFSRPLGFANALVQSFAGGNTMMMNLTARTLMCRVMKLVEVEKIVSHDWWSYLVVSGAGGVVLYDPSPSLLYRQHGGNLIGSNTSFFDRFSRIRLLLRGRFKDWTDKHIELLTKIQGCLSSENVNLLDIFKKMRQTWLFPRLFWFWRSHTYRQTSLGNLGLFVAVLLKKI